MIKKLAAVLLILIGSPLFAEGPEDLIGYWQYDGFFYEDNRYANPNPDLNLIFRFEENGTSHLVWTRKNDGEFCERHAQYVADAQTLSQTVSWVNPKNSKACAADQDMQLGRQTETHYEFHGEELWLQFDLNGKPFFYILKATVAIGNIPTPALQ